MLSRQNHQHIGVRRTTLLLREEKAGLREIVQTNFCVPAQALNLFSQPFRLLFQFRIFNLKLLRPFRRQFIQHAGSFAPQAGKVRNRDFRAIVSAIP